VVPTLESGPRSRESTGIVSIVSHSIVSWPVESLVPSHRNVSRFTGAAVLATDRLTDSALPCSHE
jgi:hypothetical protein